jgi:hypothetical protein
VDSNVERCSATSVAAGGGGVSIGSSAGVTATRTTFAQCSAAGLITGNTFGGALWVRSATMQLAECVFTSNQVDNVHGFGGGVMLESHPGFSASSTLSRCNFTGNAPHSAVLQVPVRWTCQLGQWATEVAPCKMTLMPVRPYPRRMPRLSRPAAAPLFTCTLITHRRSLSVLCWLSWH